MTQTSSSQIIQDDFFANLTRVTAECKNRLLSTSDFLVSETERLENVLKTYPTGQLTNSLVQLAQSKKEITKVIDAFYADLEQQIRAHHSKLLSDKEIETKAQNIFEKIVQEQKLINELSKDINTKEKLLDTMQAVRETDFDTKVHEIEQGIDEFASLAHQNQASLAVDFDYLDHLSQQLHQFVSIQEPSPYQDTSRPAEKRYNQYQQSPGREPLPEIVYQHSPMKLGGTIHQKGSKKPSTYQYVIDSPEKQKVEEPAKKETTTVKKSGILSPQPIPGPLISDEGTLQPVAYKQEYVNLLPKEEEITKSKPVIAARSENVTATKTATTTTTTASNKNHRGPGVLAADWFDNSNSNHWLHFFQDNSKKLHILDLKKAAKTGQFEFEEIELDIDFKIPIWHRSIITRQGIVYLTGGSGAGKNLSDVYAFDPLDNSLRAKAKMNFARNSHGICIFQDFIYVVGGCTDEEGYTAQCERYEISKYYERSIGAWEKIAPLNHPAYAPSLANLNDKYLYKFGGILQLGTLNNTVERYDPQANLWTEISFNLFGANEATFSLTAYAGCITISEDEIYVFGGSKGDSKTNETFVCRTSGKSHVIHQLELCLPTPGVFWNSGVVYGGKVYCLQNIQLNKSDAFFLSKRRLICYDGDAWEEINTDNY